jgi:glycosyltransferase involved in cell wall biosynthesis
MGAGENRSRVRAVVLATTATTPGGVWRHMVDLGTGLRCRGVRVSFALTPSAVVLTDQARRYDFPVTRAAGVLPGAVWHLHLADTFDRQSLRLMLAARPRCRALVLTEHLPRSDASDPALAERGPRPGAWSAKTAVKKAQFALADRVIAVSEGSRCFLLTRYGVPPGEVCVVVNGIPSGSAPTDGRAGAAGPPRIVAVGSLIRQKGFDVLLSAVAASRGDWVAEISGDGPHWTELTRRAAADPGTAGRVRFRGWTAEVDRVRARGDIAVLPSRWESAPYAALEAMAAGLPVVASRIDGLSETVVDGSTGFLVPPGDPVALARTIDLLSADRALARQLGSRGRQRVRECFGVDRMVDRTLEVYQSALVRRRRWGQA